MKPLTKIQKSAKGENCTLNIAGVCNYNPETVVLCHVGFNDGSGKRNRPNERNGVYGCESCHSAIDGRINLKPELSPANKYWYIARALVRTAERRDELGL